MNDSGTLLVGTTKGLFHLTSHDGESWARKQAGLPAQDCFFTVLRQAMSTDSADPAGVYFGTNSGSVFASADEGENWSEIARHLPTVLCVEVVAASRRPDGTHRTRT